MRLLLLSFVAVLAMACSRTAPFIIPEADTARDQMQIAMEQQRRARGTFDRALRLEEFEKAIAAFDAVAKRFPGDTVHTPSAYVAIGEMRFDMERYEEARQAFSVAANKYQTQPDIRCAGLWGLGRCFEKEGEREKATVQYKAVVDEFQNSTDPAIRRIVTEARTRYRMVR